MHLIVQQNLKTKNNEYKVKRIFVTHWFISFSPKCFITSNYFTQIDDNNKKFFFLPSCQFFNTSKNKIQFQQKGAKISIFFFQNLPLSPFFHHQPYHFRSVFCSRSFEKFFSSHINKHTYNTHCTLQQSEACHMKQFCVSLKNQLHFFPNTFTCSYAKTGWNGYVYECMHALPFHFEIISNSYLNEGKMNSFHTYYYLEEKSTMRKRKQEEWSVHDRKLRCQ